MFCFTNSVVLTILTALVTIIGSLIGGAHIWGYYPGKIWSQLICVFLLIPVKVRGREKIHKHTSYVFVPNHQGAFDIFLIYGFLGRNFKWMMKKSLRKLPFVGKACESAGHLPGTLPMIRRLLAKPLPGEWFPILSWDQNDLQICVLHFHRLSQRKVISAGSSSSST